MRVLVTGGAGFIGSHFAEAALRAWPRGRVTVLDNLSFAGVLENLAGLRRERRFRFVKGDIRDWRLVHRVMREADLVVNFAAETHVDRSLLESGEFLGSSVLGTHVLVETARRLRTVSKLVLMSTDEVYGPVLSGAAAESSPLRPSSPYSAAKAGGDLLALAYARSHGVPVIVPRGCNIYGPRQFPEKMIPLFTTNALLGRPLPVYGDGRQAREWLYVDDAVRALLLLCRRGRPGEIYNVGSGVWRRNLDVARRILRRIGRDDSLIRHVADRPGHDRRYAVRAVKIRALGWRPRIQFAEGLDRTVDWYRDHPEWWRPLRERAGAYFRRQYGARPAATRGAAPLRWRAR
jgi:dTDP-glucose 4,6-dehydratase